jgi:hypothetical protein
MALVIDKENVVFKRVRLSFRWLGIACGATPTLSYLLFAYTFERIIYVPNYDTGNLEITRDLDYHISQYALLVGNATWPYLMPISFVILAIDIALALRKQIREA